jgi:hypothetical protein
VKRLTSPTLKQNFKHCVDAWSDELLRKEYWKLYDRLAAYEDTGKTPEQIAEWTKAQQEGRLVVLPVPIGYPVYKANKDDYEECMPCAGNRCGCSFVRHDNNGLICGNKWTKCGFEITYIKFNYKHIPLFGKTVFLTRAEAEAALKEE